MSERMGIMRTFKNSPKTNIGMKRDKLDKLLGRKLNPANRQDVGILAWLYMGKTPEETIQLINNS